MQVGEESNSSTFLNAYLAGSMNAYISERLPGRQQAVRLYYDVCVLQVHASPFLYQLLCVCDLE